jgi:hypothetical protein
MTAFRSTLARAALVTALLAPLAALAQDSAPRAPGPRAAARAAARGFDAKAVETVQGEILAVDRISRRRHEGVHLMLGTATEKLRVDLGPSFYVDAQALKLAAGDRVEVRGARTTIGGKPALIAQEVRRGTEVLALRDASGLPLWRGRGMAGR